MTRSRVPGLSPVRVAGRCAAPARRAGHQRGSRTLTTRSVREAPPSV
ncbi:hypothetical protein ACFPM0_07900 [Pseudonocardia sulfidoxydans]